MDNLKQVKTVNVSSQLTLFWKFVVPTFYIVFFGVLTLFVLFSENASYSVGGGLLSPEGVKIAFVCFYIIGLLVLFRYVGRLKRVEFDKEFVYVTNYFKIFRYPFHNIERIERKRYLIFRRDRIFFKEPGHFGKKVTFIASDRFEILLKEKPDIKAQLPL